MRPVAPDTPRDHASPREGGFAMLFVIVIVILITGVIGALVFAGTQQARSTGTTKGELVAHDAALGSIQRVQNALAVAAKADPLSVTSATLTSALTSAGAGVTILSPSISALPVPSTAVVSSTSTWCAPSCSGSIGNTFQITNETVDDSGLRTTFQVVRYLQPTPTNPWLTLYVRSWKQRSTSASPATTPQTLRVRLAIGTMADYQILTDTVLHLDGGTVLNGRVHANGSLDEQSHPNPLRPNLTIFSDADVAGPGGAPTCTTPTGGTKPVVTTARGNIGTSIPAGCLTTDQNTGRQVQLPFGQLAKRMLPACTWFNGGTHALTSNTIACHDATNFPNGTRVEVAGSTIRIYKPSSTAAAEVLTAGIGKSVVIAFESDISLRSTTSLVGRVTFVAWERDGASEHAPSITINGNLQSDPAEGNVLGVIAASNVYVDPATCPSQITAAIAAQSGSIRLPPQYTPAYRTAGFTLPQCGAIALRGSLVSRGSIELKWTFPDGAWAGFGQRAYQWNPALRGVPPAYWPVTGPWEILEQTTADAACFTPRLVGGSYVFSDDVRCR